MGLLTTVALNDHYEAMLIKIDTCWSIPCLENTEGSLTQCI